MKITRIECTPFNLPLKHAVTFAAGTLAVNENVLVEIHTDDGLVGVAEAPSRPFFYGESQRSIVTAIEKWFAPALVGKSPFDLEQIAVAFASVEHNNTAKGAIDIALHDLIGKATQQPCHRLLGGFGREARLTYVCGFGPPEAMADEAEQIRATHGITAFKLKVGLKPAQDAAMLRAVRKRLPDALLYVDGNQGLRQHDAIPLLEAAAAQGIAWAEEPCHKDDRSGRAVVARRGGVPILGDESCRTPEEVAREIADGTIHLVSIKVARTGFRMSRDIVALALAYRLRAMSGSQGDSGIGVVAGLHFCVAHRSTQSLPAELSFHLNLSDDLLAEPLVIRDGKLAVSERPGLGISVDRDKLRHYGVR
jgi:L-Ala-D/L-Glu epimerase